MITPSRAGYGRSAKLQNFEEQADAIAQLLTGLDIKECAILGVSGGGPTAIQFALRHPDICKALLTEVAVTGNFTHPKAAELSSTATKMMITSGLAIRMAKASTKPEDMIK